jgi:hypothetical protein
MEHLSASCHLDDTEITVDLFGRVIGADPFVRYIVAI